MKNTILSLLILLRYSTFVLAESLKIYNIKIVFIIFSSINSVYIMHGITLKEVKVYIHSAPNKQIFSV